MLKLYSCLLFICVIFHSCAPVNHVAPRGSRSEYASLIEKGVGYIRESDKLFQSHFRNDSFKLSQAEAMFSLAKELRPGDPEAIDGIGSIFFRRGDIQTARVLFLQCLDLDPGYGRAYVHLAYLEEIEGRHGVSIELLKKALDLNPRDSHALNNLGGMLYDVSMESNDKDEGKRLLIQALEIGEKGSGVLEHNRKIVTK